MIDMGAIRPGRVIRIPFSSFDKDDGSSITMTGYAVADILIYKDGSTTERASTSGFTATTDFDSKTGKHLAVIDLGDNTTSGFFAAGSEYLVAIDAVTVDGVTTGGWIARFTIGYPMAVLNTTIATLSTQTSFTLTEGPAEDNALTDMWAILHDTTGKSQFSKAIVSAYTGSTKTVTLAAAPTFTIAAGDNVHLMGLAPAQTTTPGRKIDVTTGGEVGIDWGNIGNPTSSQNLSGTTVAWNAGWDAEVESECTDALNAYDPPTNTEMEARTLAAESYATASKQTDIEADTQDIQSKIGTPVALDGGSATVGSMLTKLADDSGGSSYDATSDSQAAIRSRGDSAWITAIGFSTLTAADIRTAVGLATANLDTQLAKADLTAALTEAYRSTGAEGSAAQLLYEILANITEFSISGTTKTAKKLDGSTTAKTYTLDDDTNPTSITETT